MRVIIVLKPTNKRGTKTAYTRFRNELQSNGFVLVAPEIFMRVTTNRKSAKTLIERISKRVPDTGIIRVLTLTEKQFHGMLYLTGEDDYQEKTVGANCHICL